jgi:hypothetical protein
MKVPPPRHVVCRNAHRAPPRAHHVVVAEQRLGVWILIAGAVSIALTSCGSGHSAPTAGACGALPDANGAHDRTVTVQLMLPSTVRSGAMVKGAVVVTAPWHVSFDSGQPVEVLLVGNGRVVGGGFYGAAVAGTGIGIDTQPGQPFRYPVSMVVRGCGGGDNSPNWPRNRPALRPGTYQAVAVLEDDAPSGSGTGKLLSAPVSVHVTP